eukprot:s272_g25.t1
MRRNCRRSELISKIDDILAEGWLDAKEAERLRGGMIIFEGSLLVELRTLPSRTLEGSIGGLILSPHGQCLSYFSEAVPVDILNEFFKVSCNPIHKLAVLPVLVACLLWGEEFASALLVYYIDNESARMAFVKGSGETTFASAMISDFASLECELQHRRWFGRCPSHSNPADGASRLDLSWFEGRGAYRTTVAWERLRHRLGLEGEKPDRR